MTTVHSIQVVDIDIPMLEHDVPIDYVVTRREVIACEEKEKPKGILWERLDEGKLESMPVLRSVNSRKGFM